MKHSILYLISMLACAAMARGQAPVTILGRSASDKVLPEFWSQHSNASNTVSGLNANHGAARFSSQLLPVEIPGSVLSGTFTGTNEFNFRVWDAAAAEFQSFNFDWDAGVPSNPDTVSRIGHEEPLAFKTLLYTKFANASDFLDGIVRAKGSSYAEFISPKSGTNTYYWGTNSMTFVEGVLQSSTGSTNIFGTGIEMINGLSEVALNITTNSTGTDFNITTSAGTNISINLPTASASSRGALSAADWTEFSTKQAGSLTLTALSAFNANGILAQISQNTFAARMVVSGDGTIEVTNGDGVSGDIDIRVADNGFFYIRTIAGTPSDPPPEEAGKVGCVYDTTGNKLWIYSAGVWRSATFTP